MTIVNPAYCIDLYQGDEVVGNNDEGFAQVKTKGIAFLDHKASQGTGEVDKMCAFRRGKWMDSKPIPVTDVSGTKLSLLPRFGFYHFNGTGTAVAEAAHFIATVKPMWKSGDDLCLDWEDIGASGHQQPASWANDFCDVVEQSFGFAMKIYGGDAPREQLAIATSAVFAAMAKRRFWFCQYGAFNEALVPGPWKATVVDMWQDDGDSYGPGVHNIPGISNYCDNSTVVGTMTVNKLYARWGGGLKFDGL